MWVSMFELEGILGRDMARALSLHRGGLETYVPMRADTGHALARIVGARGMEALCAEFRGQYITVPNGRNEPQKEKVLRLLAQGKTRSSIALECGVSENYVYKLAALVPRQVQLTLL